MHLVPFEFTKPTDDSAFEDMCARVYGEVFSDPLPKINGRQGQSQSGVDVFVMAAGARFGIQCKRYADGALKFKHIEEEVGKAEKKGARIVRLIVATTAASDARLIEKVHELSDARVTAGKFPVEVEFWEDICRHIHGHPKLLNDYAPNAPGAAFHRQEQRNVELLAAVSQVSTQVSDIAAALPTARPESVNKLISGQLDHVNELLKANRYSEAREGLERLGADLGPFDAHQKARWYLQRGICIWHQVSGEAATADFFKAAELYPDDDKMAAARVRALLLSGDATKAVEEGRLAADRFPASAQVWLTLANARMVAGEFVARADIPAGFENDPDVLQLVAWARHAAGDSSTAVEVSQAALQKPSAGFYVRLAAIGIAVQAALTDPVAAMHGLLDPTIKNALTASKQSLEPWDERIFSVQATKSVEEAVAMLAYGYLLLSEAERAVALLARARERGLSSARLNRAEIDALRDLGRRTEVLELARKGLPDFEDEALILVAEAAGNTGDVALTDEAAEVYRARHGAAGELSDMFKALGWVARSNSGPENQAATLAEVRMIDFAATTSLPLLLGGARVLFKAGGECLDLAATAAARVGALVSLTAPSADRISAADLLFDVEEYEKAAPYYASLAKPGALSAIHVRLLECYVRAGSRRKAKELLTALPPDWTSDDKARALAIDLGQQAGDWTFLEPIAEVQRRLHPQRTSTWLFSLQVALRGRKMHNFHELLASTPAILEGSVQQTAQLASLELRYDRAQAGMDRVYRMYRERLDDVGAAEAYFISLVAANDNLPNMEETLAHAGSGTSVTLREAHGASMVVTIDPGSAGPLVARGEFQSPSSPDVAPLMGAAVGAEVELPGGMGGPRKYVVHTVTTAYRRLLAVAQETFTRSVQAPEHLMQVAIPQTENGADFSEMHAMLKVRSEHSLRAFQLYGENPLTLGMLGKLLGHDPLDFAMAWPVDGPPLSVSDGHADAYEAALRSLARPDAAYVIDGITLVELVNLDSEAVLAHLPKVFVSSETLDRLQARLEEARTDRSSGRAVDMGGQLGYIEYSEAHKTARVAFFERVLAAVAKYCEVAPAYGPESLPDEFRRLKDILRHEEQSALLLAAERGATLFTLDGRLAGVAKLTLNLERVWPQAVLAHAEQLGQVSSEAYSLACARMFVGNRSFTSMRAQDLILMCQQGGGMFFQGIERFKQHLSNPAIDFQSIGTVCLEFLALLPQCQLTFAAFGEMLTHLCEAAFRHPHCSREAFIGEVSQLLANLISSNEPDHPYPPLKRGREQTRQAFSNRLAESVREALRNAQAPERPRPLHLKVLKCTKVPCILWTREESTQVAAPSPPSAGPEASPQQPRETSKGFLLLAPEQATQLVGDTGSSPTLRPVPGDPKLSQGIPPPAAS